MIEEVGIFVGLVFLFFCFLFSVLVIEKFRKVVRGEL